MLPSTRFLLPSLLAASLVVCHAETDCSTPTGAAVPDGQVSASAAFTVSDGSISIILTNSLADPTSAGQLLSGLAFTLSDGETTGTLTSSSAIIRQVAAGGAFTDLTTSATGWALAQNFNGGLELCVLCNQLGSLGPSHLLLGSPAGSGTYASANRSIAGNGPHNPFTAGPATFVLSVPGVTAASTSVTGATFYFSTTAGVSVAANCPSGGIPE